MLFSMAPKKSDKSANEGRFSIRTTPELLKLFKEAAKRDRRSLNAQVSVAMEEFLKEHHPDLSPPE